MQTIKVQGMSCEHCRSSVTTALQKLPGVTTISVSLEKGEASFEGENIDMERAKEAIRAIGFEAS